MKDFGKIIDELTYKATFNKSALWEATLRLHIKPKPAWCPDKLWQKLLRLVLIQTEVRRI